MIKKWLVTIDCDYIKANQHNKPLSDQDIYQREKHRTESEILISRSYNRNSSGWAHWFKINDSLHEMIKGKYSIVWIDLPIAKIVVRETEDFMVMWKLRADIPMEFEEIEEEVKFRRIHIQNYNLVDIKPDWVKEESDLIQFFETIPVNEDQCDVVKIPIRSSSSYTYKVTEIRTLTESDRKFLRYDDWVLIDPRDAAFNEITLSVLVSDSRFKEIMNHFSSAIEVGIPEDYRIVPIEYSYKEKETLAILSRDDDRTRIEYDKPHQVGLVHDGTDVGNFYYVVDFLKKEHRDFLKDVQYDFICDGARHIRVKCSEERYKEIQDHFNPQASVS